MSSRVTVAAQMRSNMRRVVTTNLTQNESQIHRDMEKKIRKYLLICKFCFWCAYCDSLYYDYENSLEPLDMTIQNAICSACGTDEE